MRIHELLAREGVAVSDQHAPPEKLATFVSWTRWSVARDEVAVRLAYGPIAARSPGPHLHRRDHCGDELVVERGGAVRGLHASRAGGGELPPHRLHVEAELLGDPLLRHARQTQPQELFDLDHRDLAKRHRLPPVWRADVNARPRGEYFCNTRAPGVPTFCKPTRVSSRGSPNPKTGSHFVSHTSSSRALDVVPLLPFQLRMSMLERRTQSAGGCEPCTAYREHASLQLRHGSVPADAE